LFNSRKILEGLFKFKKSVNVIISSDAVLGSIKLFTILRRRKTKGN